MSFNHLAPIERIIITRALAYAESKKWYVSVNDGAEIVARNVSPFAARAYMGTTGQDILQFQDAKTGKNMGWVHFIYGNDEDVIHDHSANDAMQSLFDATIA
jgi:hypothetical protein